MQRRQKNTQGNVVREYRSKATVVVPIFLPQYEVSVKTSFLAEKKQREPLFIAGDIWVEIHS